MSMERSKSAVRLTLATAAIATVVTVAVIVLLCLLQKGRPVIRFASPEIVVDIPRQSTPVSTNVINVTAPVTAQVNVPARSGFESPASRDGMHVDEPSEEAKRQALTALVLINHINWVVTKVKTHNDPMVLEEEYKNISQNALLLDTIKDEQVITLICDIMDAIVELRIDAKKRDLLKEELDQATSDALYDAVSGISFGGGVSPLGMVVGALTSVATAAVNYKRAKTNLQSNYKKQTFALDEAKMRYLNELNKSLLKNYWFVIQKYGIPDPYRVTEDDIAELIERLKDDDINRRHRFLVTKERRYAMFPNYWYWRGLTDYERGDADQADSALRTFQELQERGCKVLRYDSTAANVALLRVKIMVDRAASDEDELRRQLQVIDENSTDEDWTKKYFCAMVYAHNLRDIESAEKVLLPAIDHMEAKRSGQLVKIGEVFDENLQNGGKLPDTLKFGDPLYACKTLLLESSVAEVDEDKRVELLEKICYSATATAREKLFCYCSMGYEQALATIVPDIRKMRLYSDGKNSLKLRLPMSWVVMRDGEPMVHLTSDNSVDLKNVDMSKFWGTKETGDRGIEERDGERYATVSYNCNWSGSRTAVITFRYNQLNKDGVLDKCSQIAVLFDVSSHSGEVFPRCAAFGLWNENTWKDAARVTVTHLSGVGHD